MLIDCHIHCGLGQFKNFSSAERLDTTAVEKMKAVIQVYHKNGVDAIRDGGDRSGIGVIFRDVAKDAGIVFKTPIRALFKKGHYGDFLGDAVETGIDGKIKMDALIKEKPDFIKIILTGIMSFTDFGSSGPVGFSKSDFSQMVDHAHQNGLSVMVHANTPAGIMIALEAGADTIEHGYGIDDDCLYAMRESGVIWVPTLAPFANIARCDDNSPMKKYKKVSEAYFKQHRLMVKKAHKMGVNIALGSDSGATLVPLGQGTLDELRYLLDCGVTKEELEEIGKRVIAL
ncbi:amidohydrolase family protein [Acetobacterium woodii]|uniref:Amidohydrolase n=1 Tax=Acetobacterium woodii (strain ATCC 29683 / DSM 1030 / JCM 2381 / KCTC 1655 / WB1) TaxID=931626 RepID=H6LBY2_ACEWD|nr:amidohydrolase family protein [Acetobacterium woodii]AFA47725.1 amidohydrolase [Acetobacterium woodii DSM 1030]